ncbi:MAG TPA: CBS domain-containing protein [Gaiellaceae bacterium]|nr:CBS domain-containing protein [Gaiellaceae bacterium]
MTTMEWQRGTRGLERSVGSAMHEGVFSCATWDSLAAVAAVMAERGVHAVVVLDDPEDAQSLWGVISDLDLIAAASVRDLHEQSAGGTAASAALTITPSETLQRASQLMTEHAIAHLIVVGPDNRPLGVLSTLDVARALTGRDNRT